jgi:hypothetical protein
VWQSSVRYRSWRQCIGCRGYVFCLS